MIQSLFGLKLLLPNMYHGFNSQLLGYPNGDLTVGIEAMIIRYIGSSTGCITPFKLSRILGLAEAYYMADHGERLTHLKYVCALGTFYIEGFEELVKDCFERNPEKHCLDYKCGGVELPRNMSSYVYKAIQDLDTEDLNEINRRVLDNPFFKKLCYWQGV